MKNKILKTILEKENINSFLLAILFISPMISFIVNLDNTIPTIIVLITILLAIINRKTLLKREQLNPYLLVFLVAFSVIVIFQFVFENRTEYFAERIAYFAIFGFLACLPLHIVRKSEENGVINTEKLIKSIIIIYAILSPMIYFRNFWLYNVAERMAISYYMLPLYVSIVIEFFMDKNKSIKKYIIKYILYAIIFFPYFNFFITYLSRGAFLGAIIALILCFLWNKSLKRKITIIAVLLILVCVVSVFALDILKMIQNVLNTFNISFSFVDKNITLLETGKVGDGRDIIYENAIKDICDHPIIGNGIGYYKVVYGTYPHNFILQLWAEGGIFFLLIFMIPIIKITIAMIFDNSMKKEDVYLLIFLFSSSIIRLLLSYEFWKETFFWMYLYLAIVLLAKRSKVREKNHGKHSYTNV